MLLKCILALSFAVVVCGQLVQIVAHTRLEGSNFIQLECRETFQNGSRATVLNTQLLLFNETGEYVTSLLDREGVTHEFSERGIFSFDIDQRIEGYYYCSRYPGAGIPALAITLLAIPRKEEVPEYYERHVGESVTLRSGVGEGALAAHYTASFYKTTSNEITELTTVSRGEDFSLTISSLQLSDSGTYEPSVSITTMNGDIFYYLRNPSTITLTVYKSPIIEVAPTPIVDNEGAESVSFTCIASGGPFLRLFWFREDKNLTNYTPSQYSITNTTMNGGTKMRSVVTVHTPGFNESGRFKCVATIMDGRDGDAFKAEESADLTILESDFYLKTIITEHKQVQLWVELKNPISFYPVTAIVYFRSTANPSQEPQQVQTHSIITSTTVMVFQLEQHDVPDKFQDENFYIQVALRVDSVYSPQIPKSLDAATTANLNQPTEGQCDREKTYQTAAIVIGCVAAIAIAIAALISISIIYCCYKTFKERERRKRQAQLSAEGTNRLEKQLEEFDHETLNRQPPTPAQQEYINKRVDEIHGKLRGDGSEETDSEEKV